ncbi:54S ribosomal protein RML2, mitochondrial [Vanrija pseudolonga]|uniref:54S ribosomal protein RML2, mitochondrial n=1 Tax=Vanrija pseudolonga TaxID=143232 RepID=A0AAF0YI10_9TREE|nr:54S ribosomal protein RML2, mitochondrial [Vanrija pseudolonga]
MLSRTAQALRVGTRQVAASTSRLPTTTAATAAAALQKSRAYATEIAVAGSTDDLGPPPPPASTEAIIKRYTGPGFPRIPGLRHLVIPHHPHLYNGDPLRELTTAKRKKGGRNNSGQVVCKGIGGGHKRRLRLVDFWRVEAGVHDVVRIEYDPGRSGHIALLHRRGAAREHRVSPDEGAILAETVSELKGGTNTLREARNAVKGGWSYILAPDGLRAGDVVQSFRSGIPEGFVEGWAEAMAGEEDPAVDADEGGVSSAARALGILRNKALHPGNVLPLNLIPTGTLIHNISLRPDGRMQLCRSAGTFAQIIAHHGSDGQALGGADVLHMVGEKDQLGNRVKKAGTVLVKLQSGEVRHLQPNCLATVGMVSNKEHQQRVIAKAGRNRWLGKRPKVRGVAMNACDHPHGGGRGKGKGNKAPRSQTGVLKGFRTRRPRDKDGNKQVVTERPRGKAALAARG